MPLPTPLRLTLSLIPALLFAPPFIPAVMADAPRVRLDTTLGVIELELDETKAPKTVANFLAYVKTGHYDGTIFHRVIPGFMIQGGGFTPGMQERSTHAPIQNEADNGLKNAVGTVAMARTMDPHSASAQFFINTVDNDFLNHSEKSQRGWGYAVFGRVVAGMDIVKKIEQVPTHHAGSYGDVPVKDVRITHAGVVPAAAGATGAAGGKKKQ